LDAVRRGDIITVALNGDYGKPRPALVVQSDLLTETDSVVVCPITTHLADAAVYRLNLPANAVTGLRAPSQIMIDKIVACMRTRCGPRIGKVDADTLDTLGRLIMFVTGVTD
jgi:mRNA interferase MazF